MFSNLPFTFLFVFVTVFGTIFSVSSSHWLGIWAGLEINLIGFLPILVYQKRSSEAESAVKYFIVQALGSGLLIFGRLNGYALSFTWEFPSAFSLLRVLIIFRGLIIKIGVFPFHFWLPSVIAGLPWFPCIILATWQKAAPLFLVNSLIEVSEFNSLVLIACLLAGTSSLIGGVGGINQTQIRAILAYSSIGHLGWIIFARCHSSWSIKAYFLIYLLVSFTIFSRLWTLNTPNTKNLRNLILVETSTATALIVMLISLAGLPPLIGFISKWVVVLSRASRSLWIVLFALLLGSIISLFYYLALYFSIFLGRSTNTFLLPFAPSGSGLFISFRLILNLLGGLMIIFLNLIKEF